MRTRFPLSSFHALLLSACTAFWRQAGMTYLEYLGASSNALRQSLKEPAKSRAIARSGYWYNKTVGVNSGAVKTPVFKGPQK